MYNEVFDSFENIYKCYYRRSYSFVKSYIHDDLVAEDIASESLIKLWEEIRRQHVNNPDSFLLTILKNKSLNYLKHETIREEVHKTIKNEYDEELNLRISLLEACDPEAIYTSEIQQIIADTLAKLPQQTRLVFEMSRYANHSNKEIAGQLGITVKGVEYHISKAIKELRISLKDYLPILYFMCFLN